ncbi:hypothetical protein [Treponema brennaborense]|uniref:Uncharacterized protein n=1 Tax=Treponema brennaborense (strain DSM 12168 / CIP 105900 / DD5/3) TaxID=906968 RepID=F4LM10_TREBD|nr:hypothetical protein [Treponema brennaborense]AEE16689.1 hypothetical protein Trebr_1261 [Treponema brennaborense DSM 12168]
MAKIAVEARELFNSKSKPYKDQIDKILEKEKSILNLISKDSSGTSYKRLLLAEDMIYIATIYMTICNLSVELLSTKNTDALNEARKALYKAIIYLEEIVTNTIDAPYSEYEDRVAEIANTPLEKRYFIVRKLGLAIRLLIDAYGENTKWKWAFVELNGRFAVVAKNMLDMKAAVRDYFDPRAADYDTTIYYVRLVRKMIAQSADRYRDRYELSTHRIDDMRNALLFVSAQRRFCILLNEKEEAEELKKKAQVWKDKLELDRKKGLAQ